MRSATEWRPGSLAPAHRLLSRLQHVAQTGTASQAGEADLDFQDAIAGAVALRRAPHMFRRLTCQLRFFVAIEGLDYTYSVGDMVNDDVALLAAIVRRDGPGAQSAWDDKMVAATRYMARQFERTGSAHA